MAELSERKIRVLVAKCGLDGHDRGVRVIARAFQEAGMEVIYTGLHQTPEAVVEAAVQEDVDVVGLSVLSAAHMTLFPRVIELLKEKGASNVLLTGGGIIPDEDKAALQAMGVGELFRPGEKAIDDMVRYIREEVARRRGREGDR
jgi:methylmalonyl-CoA mutase, C-terminal domain